MITWHFCYWHVSAECLVSYSEMSRTCQSDQVERAGVANRHYVKLPLSDPKALIKTGEV